MENQNNPSDPQEQLTALDTAVRSVRRESVPPSPIWYHFALAFFGPAIVVFKTQASGLGRVLPVLVTAVLLFGVLAHDWKRRRVRPKRSMRTGTQFRSMFAYLFVFIVGLQLTDALAERSAPLLVAVLSYLFLLAAGLFLGRRAEAAARAGGPPGK